MKGKMMKKDKVGVGDWTSTFIYWLHQMCLIFLEKRGKV